MPDASLQYLSDLSAQMSDEYIDNCVVHACRIAELLLEEGRAPWIGRVRDERPHGDTFFCGPLMPKRFIWRDTTVVWTTHYVACSGSSVYDPLAGVPIDVATYAATVFRKELDVAVHFDREETERLLRNGELRRMFAPGPPVMRNQ